MTRSSPFWFILVHFGSLWFISVTGFLLFSFIWFILVQFGSFWFILVHFANWILAIFVHFGSFWFTLVHFGSFWFILVHFVHFGSVWLILVHFANWVILFCSIFVNWALLGYFDISTLGKQESKALKACFLSCSMTSKEQESVCPQHPFYSNNRKQ